MAPSPGAGVCFDIEYAIIQAMVSRETEAAPPASDGRQRRSERSREAIVEALIELVGRGSLRPTAQDVAEAAGVGIRTVFRHFSDMESLFAAMDHRVQAALLPLLQAAPPEGSLERRLQALLARRAELFEKIAPYKRSGNAARARSPFLRSRHTALVRALRADLLRWLPELREAEDDLLDAFDLALSFESWDRLRSDQRLGRERAGLVVERTVLTLARSLGKRGG
jgi:AcrR family transcriptional regulator